MRLTAVGSLLRQLRHPPQYVSAGFHGAQPPFIRLDPTPTGSHRASRSGHAWQGRVKMSMQALSGDSACVSAEVYKAVEERLGKLSTAPSIPPLPPLKVVISGPSGVGKDAVIKALQASRPNLHFVVTATSRPKRPGEVDGVDYIFVSKDQFEEWIRAGELLEWALVYGDYKGIPKRQVEEALARGTDVVFRLDIQGAHTIRCKFPDALSIFLVAESEAVLACRLISRKTEPLDKMITRVQTARQEMRHLRSFDFVVVNRDGDLEGAVRQIDGIITAEKHRIGRLRWKEAHDAGSVGMPAAAGVTAGAATPELQTC